MTTTKNPAVEKAQSFMDSRAGTVVKGLGLMLVGGLIGAYVQKKTGNKTEPAAPVQSYTPSSDMD